MVVNRNNVDLAYFLLVPIVFREHSCKAEFAEEGTFFAKKFPSLLEFEKTKPT